MCIDTTRDASLRFGGQKFEVRCMAHSLLHTLHYNKLGSSTGFFVNSSDWMHNDTPATSQFIFAAHDNLYRLAVQMKSLPNLCACEAYASCQSEHSCTYTLYLKFWHVRLNLVSRIKPQDEGTNNTLCLICEVQFRGHWRERAIQRSEFWLAHHENLLCSPHLHNIERKKMP